MPRPIREILNSDVNYFEKKVNKYKNQQINIKKELKELKKNSAQNVDAILKKLEYLDNLNPIPLLKTGGQGKSFVLVGQLPKALVQKQPGPRFPAPIQNLQQQPLLHGPARGVVGGAEHDQLHPGADGAQNILGQQKAVLPLQGIERGLAARRQQRVLVVCERGDRQQSALGL